MGSRVFPGKGFGWCGGVVPPAVPPMVPPFPPPPYPAMWMMYPPPPAYQGMQPQAQVQQRPQDGGTAWGTQEGKGEEHRRAWERIGEAERSLREREARVMGEAGRAAEGRTKGQAGRREGKHGQWRSCRGRGRTIGEGRRGLRGRNGREDDKRREGGRRVAPH